MTCRAKGPPLARWAAAALLWTVGVPATASETPGVRAPFAEGWVAVDEMLVLELPAALLAQRARLRVFVGRHDLSALVRMTAPGRLKVGGPAGAGVGPGALVWEPGETEVVLWLAEATEWRELGRWPLRVRTAAGFESSRFEPRLEGRLGGRAAERRSDGAAVVPRGSGAPYGDAGARGGITFAGQRSGWQLDATTQLQASTFRGEALRYAQLREAAPRVDLAEYRLAAASGRWRFALGHAELGQHPLLMDGFAARGLAVRAPLGDRLDVAFNASSGSQIVGVDNLAGIEERQHRIHGAMLGADLAEGWRFELSGLDARQQARPDFGAGSVADHERSLGLGWRLRGKAAAGRARLDAAWARSRHEHPFDAALARTGTALVTVQAATRDAHRVEVQGDLLVAASAATAATATAGTETPMAADFAHTGAAAAGVDMTPDATPTLTIGLLHERSAPLYRSLAAVVSGDQRHGRVSATAAWRGAGLTLAAAEREDNLGRVPTLLTTGTQERQAALTLPLPRWWGTPGGTGGRPDAAAPGVRTEAASPPPPERDTFSLWPQLSLSAQRVHQRALDAPATDASGFAATHRPDQVSSQRQWQASWSTTGGLSLAVGGTRSRVDNRQVGRETADFDTLAHQLSLGVPLAQALRVQFSGQRSRQMARETGLAQRSESAALQADWMPAAQWTLGVSASAERNPQARQAAVSWQIARRLEWTVGGQRLPGQITLRAAVQQTAPSTAAEALQGARLRQGWIDTGLTLSLP